MKSLEERIADRERREDEAEKSKQERSEILNGGTLAEGTGAGSDGESQDTSYNSWKVDELKEELDRRGVDYATNAKKADLIAALEGDDGEEEDEAE